MRGPVAAFIRYKIARRSFLYGSNPLEGLISPSPRCSYRSWNFIASFRLRRDRRRFELYIFLLPSPRWFSRSIRRDLSEEIFIEKDNSINYNYFLSNEIQLKCSNRNKWTAIPISGPEDLIECSQSIGRENGYRRRIQIASLLKGKRKGKGMIEKQIVDGKQWRPRWAFINKILP